MITVAFLIFSQFLRLFYLSFYTENTPLNSVYLSGIIIFILAISPFKWDAYLSSIPLPSVSFCFRRLVLEESEGGQTTYSQRVAVLQVQSSNRAIVCGIPQCSTYESFARPSWPGCLKIRRQAWDLKIALHGCQFNFHSILPVLFFSFSSLDHPFTFIQYINFSNQNVFYFASKAVECKDLMPLRSSTHLPAENSQISEFLFCKFAFH